MTVRELIEKLSKYDPNSQVQVIVRQYTKAYPVAIVEPFSVDQCYSGAAIYISLPDNMHTVVRKEAVK